ncbi:uncharacterized protein LOC127848929 [Dreissena polymorpha]|uniref:Uncharacterized protein n=1 Tax=Dreissena polymorpha TaxID=45954 RepID=A0A9D4DS90_DREPO|nr:uncharacterized protein LOC127848780 [Dreissena polymorpha]XP_052237617.1 uncharacterized protein LOC127848929 [Dreissena polymorpha]KAH3754041.1 hypothetical protein DPMN_188699 [Dreissena polymorpha]KAH3754113.1 hypothetical protein DPMN_188774 [Dreissena polymorpha]
MADKGRNADGDGQSETKSSLEDFVTENYQKQKDEGRLDSTNELTDQRTSDFFSRALSESRRMSAEVNKSHRKLDKIHTEFGTQMVNSWQAEHMTEVLQPHEQDFINKAKYQNPQAPSEPS